MSKAVVVYVGIEWDQLPESFAPERKLEIKAGVEGAMAELIQLGYDARWCGVATDPAAAVATVRAAVGGERIDCVLIGAGLRTTDQALVLFERIVNEIHTSCPHAAICFNSNPGDSAAAVQRSCARAPVAPKPADDRYDTRMDNKYGYLTTIDIPAEVAEHEPWFNQTLTQVNDSLIRLGIFGGEYHWHKHDHEDECFVVLDGELELDIEGRGTIVLGRQLGYTVPKGVVHRTRARTKTVVLMIEAATVTPTGD